MEVNIYAYLNPAIDGVKWSDSCFGLKIRYTLHRILWEPQNLSELCGEKESSTAENVTPGAQSAVSHFSNW